MAHPQGHSHDPAGAHPAAGPLLAPERWRECADYLYGVDLYNRWYWWEAHEAWEGIWQQSDKQGPQGHFLQFLIQVSACHLQRHMGRNEGVQRIWTRSARHHRELMSFLGSNPQYMGLDVAAFAGHADQWLHGAGGMFPFIRLSV